MTTIGVAVAVPEPWGERLREYRASLGDPTAGGIPTHITLLPPFEIEDDRLPTVEQHLVEASSRNSAFKVHLRGAGTFRPVSPVVFVAVVAGISQCEQLAFSVRRGRLAAELQYPYHPHVTVAHQLDEVLLDKAFSELASFECEFVADHFSLYVHDSDLGWQATRDFSLAASSDT